MLRGLLSSCSKQGPLSGSSMRASLCRGFSQWGAQALGHVGSEVAAPGPWSSSSKIVVPGLSCSLACRILPDQGLNPCLPTESVLNPFSTQVNFWDLYIPAEGRRQKRGCQGTGLVSPYRCTLSAPQPHPLPLTVLTCH